MSTGIGRTQQRILDTLIASKQDCLTVVALAEQLGVSPRQVRRAVHSLAFRGLVVLTKEPGGWKGIGSYGQLRRRDMGYWDHDGERVPSYGPEVPTAYREKHRYQDWDEETGELVWRSYITEYVHVGMPTGIALFVWLTTEACPLDREGQRVPRHLLRRGAGQEGAGPMTGTTFSTRQARPTGAYSPTLRCTVCPRRGHEHIAAARRSFHIRS